MSIKNLSEWRTFLGIFASLPSISFFFLPFLLSSSENEIRSHQYVTLYPTQAHPKFSDIGIIRKMQKDKT